MNDTMAELPFTGEDNVPSLKLYASGEGHSKDCFKLDETILVPSEDLYSPKNGHCLYPDPIEQQIAESLDKLSTKSDKSEGESDSDEKFRKRVRVGNHYQARIPKYTSDSDYDAQDELVWDPFVLDPRQVDDFLKRIADLTKLLIPMGSHLRDDEKALYILQKHEHDVEGALGEVTSGSSGEESNVWSEEECRNFERGLLSFGKNFFLIQKYRVRTRHVKELVQFYYLWKKTERYDLFAHRMRGGKKKYALNPGISDLMCRYLGRQGANLGSNLGSDVQLIVTDVQKSVP